MKTLAQQELVNTSKLKYCLEAFTWQNSGALSVTNQTVMRLFIQVIKDKQARIFKYNHVLAWRKGNQYFFYTIHDSVDVCEILHV